MGVFDFLKKKAYVDEQQIKYLKGYLAILNPTNEMMLRNSNVALFEAIKRLDYDTIGKIDSKTLEVFENTVIGMIDSQDEAKKRYAAQMNRTDDIANIPRQRRWKIFMEDFNDLGQTKWDVISRYDEAVKWLKLGRMEHIETMDVDILYYLRYDLNITETERMRRASNVEESDNTVAINLLMDIKSWVPDFELDNFNKAVKKCRDASSEKLQKVVFSVVGLVVQHEDTGFVEYMKYVMLFIKNNGFKRAVSKLKELNLYDSLFKSCEFQKLRNTYDLTQWSGFFTVSTSVDTVTDQDLAYGGEHTSNLVSLYDILTPERKEEFMKLWGGILEDARRTGKNAKDYGLNILDLHKQYTL